MGLYFYCRAASFFYFFNGSLFFSLVVFQVEVKMVMYGCTTSTQIISTSNYSARCFCG